MTYGCFNTDHLDIAKLGESEQELVRRIVHALEPADTDAGEQEAGGLSAPTELWSVVVARLPSEDGPLSEPRTWTLADDDKWLTAFGQDLLGVATSDDLVISEIKRVGL